MRALRNALASLFVVALSVGVAFAASTTSYSDQWWVPSESGWGASVQQQSNMLFIDLLVYGSDGKPAWFTAAASLQSREVAGHDIFTGDLYETAGPHFAGTFNPALVTSRKVGTLTFDATSSGNGTLSYTIDGTPVVKSVTRQTWTYENLSGTYDAVWSFGCGGVMSFASEWGFTQTVIQHNPDNSVTITVSLWLSLYQTEHHLRGTYSQFGHLGRISTGFNAPAVGSITIDEIETTATGFTGRIPLAASSACHKDGRIVAVRRP